jgi:hypothetical protein
MLLKMRENYIIRGLQIRTFHLVLLDDLMNENEIVGYTWCRQGNKNFDWKI